MTSIGKKSEIISTEKLSSVKRHNESEIDNNEISKINDTPKDNFKNNNVKQGSSATNLSIIKEQNINIPKNGVWIWNTNDFPKSDVKLDEFLNLASKKGFNRLYVNGHPGITGGDNPEFFKKLVEKASNHNIKIEILLGNPEWLTDPKQEKVFKENFLPAIIDFWKDCPSNLKPALHLDIEPQSLPGWKNNKEMLLNKTMSLYDDINKIFNKSGANIEVSADIPHWWDDIKLKNGKSAFESISEKVSNVVIMSYGENSDKVKSFSKDELSSPNSKKVTPAIETDGSSLIGWDNNDKPIKGENLKKAVDELYKSTGRLSFHPRPGTDLLKMFSSLPDR